jgi:hypothetical protein
MVRDYLLILNLIKFMRVNGKMRFSMEKGAIKISRKNINIEVNLIKERGKVKAIKKLKHQFTRACLITTKGTVKVN